MAKEALEAITGDEKNINIQYEIPAYHRRFIAAFIDLVIFFLLGIGCYILTELATHATPVYKHADELVAKYREESGVFRYSNSRKTWENISTYLDNNNDLGYPNRISLCQTAINDFNTYIYNAWQKEPGTKYDNKRFDNITEATYNFVINDYNSSRLSDKLKDEYGNKLFIQVSEEIDDPDSDDPADTITVKKIIKNPDSKASDKFYYTHFYREYTLEHCGSFLISFFPEYKGALKTMSNFLFYIQIPVAITVASFLTYAFPPLVVGRGKPTIGMIIYHIGRVDSSVLSLKAGRFMARYAIFFFGIIVLSLFTFGIPLLASTTMMIFSKKKQSFPDYMLGIVEVDTNKNKIFKNKYEVSLDNSIDHKEAIDFKMSNRE